MVHYALWRPCACEALPEDDNLLGRFLNWQVGEWIGSICKWIGNPGHPIVAPLPSKPETPTFEFSPTAFRDDCMELYWTKQRHLGGINYSHEPDFVASLTRVHDAAHKDGFAQQSHLVGHGHLDWMILLGVPKTCLRNLKNHFMFPGSKDVSYVVNPRCWELWKENRSTAFA